MRSRDSKPRNELGGGGQDHKQYYFQPIAHEQVDTKLCSGLQEAKEVNTKVSFENS